MKKFNKFDQRWLVGTNKTKWAYGINYDWNEYGLDQFFSFSKWGEPEKHPGLLDTIEDSHDLIVDHIQSLFTGSIPPK